MDFEKMKADLKAAREKKEMLYQTDQLRHRDRRYEIDEIKQQFRTFFKIVHSFSVPTTPKDMDPIIARYESLQVTLKENKERNEQEKGYKVYFTLTTPDEMVHTIFADAKPFRRIPKVHQEDPEMPDEAVSESEITDDNVDYHRDLRYGRIIYKYKYMIEGDNRVFEDLQTLIEGI